MFNFLPKLIFYLKKPRIIIVSGSGRQETAEAVLRVLKKHFRVIKISEKFPGLRDVFQNDTIIIESELADPVKSKEFNFLIKEGRLSILTATHVGEFHPEKEFFAGELSQVREITKLVQNLSLPSYLIVNYDDETIRDLKNKTMVHSLTFGLSSRADFQASDIIISQGTVDGKLQAGTSFKINYNGKTVPIRLKLLFGKKYIYASLAAVCCGVVFGQNLVELSESLELYEGINGEMRLIEGIKNSYILDNSENASSFSMAEALEILKKIEANRKIAVLGDIVGIGKYSIEAHEAIGERVINAANLLFTVGPRAKFIAKEASEKGFPSEKIFSFDETNQATKVLQKEMKEGDLVLIEGSKEMRMSEVTEEIKAI